MFTKFRLAMLALLTFTLAQAGTAFADPPPTHHWRDLTLVLATDVPSDTGTLGCGQSQSSGHGWTIPVGGDAEAYYYNLANGPTDISSTYLISDIQAGFAVWNNESNDCARSDSSNFAFASLGSSTAAPQLGDGINVIGFSTGMASSVIGLTHIDYVDNPTGLESVVEWDIELNADFDWQTSSTPSAGNMDLWNVVTHEVGHVVGVGHPNVNCQTPAQLQSGYETMFKCSNYEEIHKRSLGLGDMLRLEQIVDGRPTS